MSNLQINTRVRRLLAYLDDFEKGKIQVPPFQRDFVWNNNRKLDLMDSLKNGYPIGSVLFWQPELDNEDNILDDEVQSIGSYQLRIAHNDFFFILDGYQRLSTLFGCFVDPHDTSLGRNEQEWKEKFDIVYNLRSDKFEYNRKTRNELEVYQIPLFHFVNGEKFYDFQTTLSSLLIPEDQKRQYIQRYKNFGSKITSYDIPSIDLIGGNITEAIDIFSRLNSKGENISPDWKVSALSFSRAHNYRFGSEMDNLFVRLKRYNFFNDKSESKSRRELVLKCVINSFDKVFFDVSNDSRELEDLAQQSNFIEVSRKAFRAIEQAVKFLYYEVMVLDSKLLPYGSQLIFITEFFMINPTPSVHHLKKLAEWFWKTTYANYFTIYNLSLQRMAYMRFRNFAADSSEDPMYYDKQKNFLTADFPSKIAMGSVRAKALALFMINYAVKKEYIFDIGSLRLDAVVNYKNIKIFKGFSDKRAENRSENTVMLVGTDIDNMERMSSREILDYLYSGVEDSEAYFVSREMISSLRNGNDLEYFLEQRFDKLQAAEILFVQNRLGLHYSIR